MSDPKGTQGPTMEEILASIRKMIPEDEENLGPAPPGRAPESGQLVPGATETRELVLTQMLAEDGSVVRLNPAPVPPPQEALLLTNPVPPDPPSLPSPPVPPAAPIPGPAGSGETLEAFVRRALEPQIQAWLEAHLPAMVERMVQDVIDRIRRESEKDKPAP